MHDLVAHEEYVRCNRREKVAALALADRYQEELPAERFHSLRLVGLIRKRRRDAVEMAEAAELLRPDSRYSALLYDHIWTSSPILPVGAGQVIVVAGSRPPQSRLGRVRPGRSWWRDVTVLVGARWVLACWRDRVLHQEASAVFG